MIFGIDLSALLPFIAVGFAAQMVDGALGMAFGVINSTLLVSVMGLWTIAALVQYTHDKASYERGALRAIFAQDDNTAPVGDRGFRDFMFTMSAAHLALSTAVFGPPLQKWLGWPEL